MRKSDVKVVNEIKVKTENITDNVTKTSNLKYGILENTKKETNDNFCNEHIQEKSKRKMYDIFGFNLAFLPNNFPVSKRAVPVVC